MNKITRIAIIVLVFTLMVDGLFAFWLLTSDSSKNLLTSEREVNNTEVVATPTDDLDSPTVVAPEPSNETSSDSPTAPSTNESSEQPISPQFPVAPTNPTPAPPNKDSTPPRVVTPIPTPAPTNTRPPVTPSCPNNVTGSVGSAPSRVSAGGVTGTTSDDIVTFAKKFNEVRIANCLVPIPLNNFKYDSCMEDRLFWMAEDPSTDLSSAWGHIGSVRSDGVPSYGCDGNLAGGYNNTGATVAQKWWDSTSHRNSLYRPTITNITNVCIYFAMTHGGVPDEPYNFTRAAARWGSC